MTPWSGSVASSSSAPVGREVGDGDVVAHVDQLLALGLRVPVVERLGEGLALALDAEVDVGGRAAERRRGLARLDVVDRDRAAERHVEVRVRVDAARQQVLAASRRSTRSASMSSDSPIRVTRSPSTKTSAT